MKNLKINPDDMSVVMRVFNSILDKIQSTEGKRYCSVHFDISKGCDGDVEIEWGLYSPRIQEIFKGVTIEEALGKMWGANEVEAIEVNIKGLREKINALEIKKAQALAEEKSESEASLEKLTLPDLKEVTTTQPAAEPAHV